MGTWVNTKNVLCFPWKFNQCLRKKSTCRIRLETGSLVAADALIVTPEIDLSLQLYGSYDQSSVSLFVFVFCLRESRKVRMTGSVVFFETMIIKVAEFDVQQHQNMGYPCRRAGESIEIDDDRPERTC